MITLSRMQTLALLCSLAVSCIASPLVQEQAASELVRILYIR